MFNRLVNVLCALKCVMLGLSYTVELKILRLIIKNVGIFMNRF